MKYNIRYTIEYILKLQIHQHSLLARKVFSWNNSSAQVFITRSSSKLDHHHHWIIIIAPCISSKWCYLSILLVIGSSTELALFHDGYRPSLHVGIHLLQHLYLTQSEKTAQHLHLTMGGTHPPPCQKGIPNNHIWPSQEGPALTSDHGRPNLPPC